MQNSYTLEALARLTQQDRLADAESRRLAHLAAARTSHPGVVATLLSFFRGTSDTATAETGIPRLAGYPAAH